MFRSSTIIRELALNLAKVTFMLNYVVIYYAVVWQHVHARRNFTECFNINITLARFSASSLMMVEDRNM